ncbi:hypothetical protein SARC_11291 [Sphaeroforma arctica JP610]|uniref:Uncharacterized protein n=1 Tax=Sphaeroforma arctica JP610 TaxID=667725 RepID=A0A0L0FHE6_9EUKA|nr:hypothetical protein SARC_11291 [Sphaeroforma arctica JP610]KNC76197.1 hypothetical protein SARC_11291 [Sphaeroforma arctica JP610]|eukprot:XP_014150099.1 hypothetical protein SARC_11291 [Sphaeroforma arctica JP610]
MKMSAHDLAVAGTYSFLLTIVNIICIYLMGLLMFKIKEVAPIPGKTDFWKSAVHAQRLHPRGKGYGNHGLPMDIRSSAELDVEAQSQGTYHTQYQSTLRNNNTYQGAVPDEVYGTGFGALMAYRPPVHEQSHLNQLNNQFTLTQRTLNALNNSTMQRGGHQA